VEDILMLTSEVLLTSSCKKSNYQTFLLLFWRAQGKKELIDKLLT